MNDLISRILREFVGMNLNELTRAEQNIMDLCLLKGKLLMPTNEHAEFMAPVRTSEFNNTNSQIGVQGTMHAATEVHIYRGPVHQK